MFVTNKLQPIELYVVLDVIRNLDYEATTMNEENTIRVDMREEITV